MSHRKKRIYFQVSVFAIVSSPLRALVCDTANAALNCNKHTATLPCAHRNTRPHLLRLYNSVYPPDTRYLSAHRWWISYQPTVCPCFPFRTAVVSPLCQLCVRCVSISSVFILQTQFSCLQNSCGCPLSTVCPCSCLFCGLSFPVSTTC